MVRTIKFKPKHSGEPIIYETVNEKEKCTMSQRDIWNEKKCVLRNVYLGVYP